MKTLKQLIESKSKKLATVSPKDTVLHALEIMAEHDVGALIVLDGLRLAGMFSERDYARKVILQGKVSVYTKVSDIMTDKVISVTMNHTVEQCLAIMSEKHFRHLPVLDDEGLVDVFLGEDRAARRDAADERQRELRNARQRQRELAVARLVQRTQCVRLQPDSARGAAHELDGNPAKVGHPWR